MNVVIPIKIVANKLLKPAMIHLCKNSCVHSAVYKVFPDPCPTIHCRVSQVIHKTKQQWHLALTGTHIQDTKRDTAYSLFTIQYRIFVLVTE